MYILDHLSTWVTEANEPSHATVPLICVLMQAYGEQGVGVVIPSCSTLLFEVELIDIAN